jgi:hypothetical protein
MDKQTHLDSDLTKPIPELFDAFITATDEAFINVETKLMLNVQRCTGAIMARVGMTNEKLTNQIKWFTIGIFSVAILQIIFMILSYFYPYGR